jgi:hypothetical protein
MGRPGRGVDAEFEHVHAVVKRRKAFPLARREQHAVRHDDESQLRISSAVSCVISRRKFLLANGSPEPVI